MEAMPLREDNTASQSLPPGVVRMQPSSYAIVLSSTATHAYWNFLLKRARGGSVFVGLSKVAEVVLSAPAFLWMTARSFPLRSDATGLVIVGAVLVLFNYAALARAY